MKNIYLYTNEFSRLDCGFQPSMAAFKRRWRLSTVDGGFQTPMTAFKRRWRLSNVDIGSQPSMAGFKHRWRLSANARKGSCEKFAAGFQVLADI
jgi:hypothetical protein